MDYSDLIFEDKFDMAIREKAMEVHYNQGVQDGIKKVRDGIY